MRLLIFVITIMPLLAFSKNLSWSKKWVQEYNNKSWAQVCKKPTTRAAPICKSLKKAMLEDKSKFKWKSTASDTLEVTYKKYSVKIRRSDDPLVYLVNRRSLYLEEIKNLKQLSKEVQKLLPKSETTSASLWIQYAAADDFPTFELGQMITLMLVQSKEQEICETAQKLVKACKPFDDNLISKIKSLRKESPDELPDLINHRKNLKAAYNIITQAEHFVSLFASIDESKTAALNKCECKEGLCQIKEKKTDMAEAYADCKANIKSIKDLTKAADLKHIRSDLLSEEIDRLTIVISDLEKKKTAESAGGFKEESFKSHR